MGKQCEWRRLTYWSTVNAIKVGMARPRVLEPLERHRGHRTHSAFNARRRPEPPGLQSRWTSTRAVVGWRAFVANREPTRSM